MPEEKQPFEIIDVSEPKPEDVGTLSLRYVDGVPTLVVSGGEAVPVSLTVVNDSGAPVAAYVAGPAVKARSMSVDLDASFYIADTSNHRVR
ncbi:hypothetical protein [Streptomyces sp. ISL-11]|uniref:hypothetical protein n=1 Tax=Streptomyces sp. ISL-11 TaxID=2819174 RepID=UPI001BE7DE01|nr:hypothetical protein [Streptomyces sp. ISL-11]MBT2384439.1 hypothetical protein [Streptomyces sp. ISL-11]